MSRDWYEQDSWYAPNYQAKSNEKTVNVGLGRKGRWIALTLAALVLIGAGVFYGLSVLHSEQSTEKLPDDYKDFFSSYYTTTDNEKINTTLPEAPKQSFSVSVSETAGEKLELGELYRRCSASIVAIKSYEEDADEDSYAWGSGIVISDDGLILTNTHIISDSAKAVIILSDDREFDAQIVGSDTISDISVLKIDAENLKPASFGDSGILQVGDRVAAIGNPLGEIFRMTMTDGIISAISRGLQYNGHTMELLQTNAAINEGNSGGALFNMYGQVIGVTNMKMMSYYSSIEGIGFAIPSKTVISVVNELISEGTVTGRASLGVVVGSIPDGIAEEYGIPGGLYVSSAAEGSDAEAKGIKEGDIIITVDGEPVTVVDDVNRIKDGKNIGDTMKLHIYRDGEEFDIEVELMDTNKLYG